MRSVWGLHLPVGNGALDKMAPEWVINKGDGIMRKLKEDEMQVLLIIILCGMVARACCS